MLNDEHSDPLLHEQTKPLIYGKWFINWDQFISYFDEYKDQINRSLTTDLGNLINKAKHDPSLTYKND